jgi:cytochrome c-type protein NapB
MKKIITMGLGILLTGILLNAPVSAEGVTSLRGSNPLNEKSKKPEMLKWQDDHEPFQRDYVQQPPLIPHDISGYKINKKFNKCLTCHSWANYRDSGATKVSQTHFKDRENTVLANIAPRRYFCTQCHVSQVNAPPLVENTFNALKTIKK